MVCASEEGPHPARHRVRLPLQARSDELTRLDSGANAHGLPVAPYLNLGAVPPPNEHGDSDHVSMDPKSRTDYQVPGFAARPTINSLGQIISRTPITGQSSPPPP